MFSSVIDLVKLFLAFLLAGAKFASIGIPVIGLIAVTLIVAGCWLDRRKYARLLAAYDLAEERRLEQQIAADQQAEETQNQRLGELILLLGGLTTFTYRLCGTDEMTEAWREVDCEESGEEYHLPAPVDGCQDLYIEVETLHTVLSQCARDLEENRSWYVDIEFYRQWTDELHKRYNQWCERRQAIAELKLLQQRLIKLEEALCRFHDVRVVKWEKALAACPQRMETYQDVYQTAIAQRKLIALRIEKLEDAGCKGICLATAAYADMVEILEEYHQMLDGYEDVFDLFTKEEIKEEARKGWRNVVSSTPESRSALLQEFLAESNGKYLKGFTQARRSLLKYGPCGQKKAVESFKTALIHWSCGQALMLVLREQIDCVEDLTDPLTIERYAHEFDLAVLWKCEQDLQALEISIHTFHEDFEQSCANLLLSSL